MTRPYLSSLLTLAALAGLAHALASLYWAAGGTWLLPTVGTWAVDWSRSAPLLSSAVLLVVGTGKLALALSPLLVGDPPRWLRGSWWAAGLLLAAYGTANSLGALSVLTGIVPRAAGTDQAALVGHALLWDPLFAIWGVALVCWLWRTRGAGRRQARKQGALSAR